MAAHRLQVQWARTGPSEEDVMVCTFDFLDDGDFPQAGEYAAAEVFLDQWWIDMRALYPESIQLVGYRWYKDDSHFEPFGPPDRVQAKLIPGTSGNPPLPPQCAISVTERTGHAKKHWGRFYLPSPATDVLLQDARISSAARDIFAEATRDMYDGLGTLGLQGIVACMVNGLPVNAEIREIAVDDVFDVIRRRRYEVVLARSVRTVTDITP